MRPHTLLYGSRISESCTAALKILRSKVDLYGGIHFCAVHTDETSENPPILNLGLCGTIKNCAVRTLGYATALIFMQTALGSMRSHSLLYSPHYPSDTVLLQLVIILMYTL